MCVFRKTFLQAGCFRKSLLNKYMLRVDTKNPIFAVLIGLYGWIFGILFWGFCKCWTLTLKLKGTEERDTLLDSRYVLVLWHEDLILFFLSFPKLSNQIWMNHPAWFMKPIHVTLYLLGVRNLALGSSGNSGKEALIKVVESVRSGMNTVVAVDGPAGPPKVMKPGAILMSQQTGIPLRSLSYTCERYYRLGGWDYKLVPKLFSKVEMHLGPPIHIGAENEITQTLMDKLLKP